jgi:hypothetical protein
MAISEVPTDESQGLIVRLNTRCTPVSMPGGRGVRKAVENGEEGGEIGVECSLFDVAILEAILGRHCV